MNTNMKELNLNEMEKVTGSGLWSTMTLSIATEIVRYKTEPGIGYEPYVKGGIDGFFKGAWKGIFGSK